MATDDVNALLGSETLDRVKDMAADFGDNKDRILEAVDWVWDHRDELIDLTKRLPELLGQAGESLAVAGDGAVRASGLLTGEDGDSVGGLTGAAADALDRCLGQIDAAAELMAGVADQVDDVPMMDGVGGSLAKGAVRLEGIGGELGEVATDLRAAGVKITDAGGDLADVGSGLREGGAELARFGGRELREPKAGGSRKGRSETNSKPRPKSTTKHKARAKPKSAAKPKNTAKPKSTPPGKASSSGKKSSSGGGLDLGNPT